MRGNTHRRARRPAHARAGLLHAVGAAAGALIAAGAADAQTVITDPDRTYVYSNSGVMLPSNTPSYGQDEVQAAGGVACRSSVGGGGPYVDMGIVGSQDPYSRNTTSAYARIVVPLGERPRRIDCSQLYQLEIERLRMELELARMSLPTGDLRFSAAGQPTAAFAAAANEGAQ